MPKLVKVETTHTYLAVDVTDAQVTEARKGDREFEALLASVQGSFKTSHPTDRSTEFVIE
jgi:hypothetical protein